MPQKASARRLPDAGLKQAVNERMVVVAGLIARPVATGSLEREICYWAMLLIWLTV
jgi:hypothetical protein